ncbi:MAG TPA: CPBP family intramembrane glutamic endopeptidase [Candidatus Eisenbacteria bacterium]|nr:CPBP family intramembrane glutamic endopeptidase [Candidatus Eisenbacteria bacterium]
MESNRVAVLPQASFVSTRSRLWAVLELALAAAFIVLTKLHRIWRPDTMWLLALGWISLRVRKRGWGSVGLRRPESWGKVFLAALVAAVALQAVSLWITVPLATRITGQPPDLSEFRQLIGHWKLALLGLAVTWTLAAFGEELVHRGYLMNRMADVGNGSRVAWAVSYVVISVAFGLGHLYQGPSGVMDATVTGLVLGGLYLAFGRNLWPAILAHGFSDTLALVMVYCGFTPGVKI